MPFPSVDFPNLHPGNHHVTSPANDGYNCIAWAAGIHDEWWEPASNGHWPANAPRDYNFMSLIAAYESVGFEVCPDGTLEAGMEKIAIYTDAVEYMHAARQLETGMWTSKMGEGEDIEHDSPDDVAGPCLGHVAVFMKRQRAQEET